MLTVMMVMMKMADVIVHDVHGDEIVMNVMVLMMTRVMILMMMLMVLTILMMMMMMVMLMIMQMTMMFMLSLVNIMIMRMKMVMVQMMLMSRCRRKPRIGLRYMATYEGVADVLLTDVRNLTVLDVYNSVYEVMERLGFRWTPGHCLRLVGSRSMQRIGHGLPRQTLVRGRAFWKLRLWGGGLRLRGRRPRLDLTRLCKRCRAA